VDGWWPDEAATDLALASDGTIFVAGYWRNSIATLRRYSAAGQLLHWTEAVGQAGNSVRVALTPDARVLLGYTDATTSNYDLVVRKYHWDLTPDLTFGGSGEARVAFDLGGAGQDFLADLAVQPDGKIVLAGAAQYSGADYDVALARLTWFGLIDSCCFGTLGRATFPIDLVPGGADGAAALALAPDGAIAVAGKAESFNPPGTGILFRLAANGAWDPVFGLRTFHPSWALGISVTGLARQDDGRLLVVGSGYDPGAGEDDGWALRFLPGGAPDGSSAAAAWPASRSPRAPPRSPTTGSRPSPCRATRRSSSDPRSGRAPTTTSASSGCGTRSSSGTASRPARRHAGRRGALTGAAAPVSRRDARALDRGRRAPSANRAGPCGR